MRLIFKWLYLVAILSQSCKARYASAYSDNADLVLFITYYYIDTDEIPGFFHLLKNHIFIAPREDTILIFHV